MNKKIILIIVIFIITVSVAISLYYLLKTPPKDSPKVTCDGVYHKCADGTTQCGEKCKNLQTWDCENRECSCDEENKDCIVNCGANKTINPTTNKCECNHGFDSPDPNSTDCTPIKLKDLDPDDNSDFLNKNVPVEYMDTVEKDTKNGCNHTLIVPIGCEISNVQVFHSVGYTTASRWYFTPHFPSSSAVVYDNVNTSVLLNITTTYTRPDGTPGSETASYKMLRCASNAHNPTVTFKNYLVRNPYRVAGSDQSKQKGSILYIGPGD